MPVDGRLSSRREITGRALGTVGLQEEKINIIIEDFNFPDPDNGLGLLSKKITQTLTAPPTTNTQAIL